MSKQWVEISWDSCAYCGSDAVEVNTEIKPAKTPAEQQVYDGDDARCNHCGCFGIIFVDSDYLDGDSDEPTYTAHVRWHDEAGCQCEWCKTHPDDNSWKEDT
jgi:hypothetical protein